MYRIIILALLILAMGCSKKAPPMEKPAPFVTVAKAETKTVPYIVDAIGLGDAYSSINIIPEVTGVIVKLNFVPGSHIHKNDVIVEIDKRPFEAALLQAQGQLAQNQAQLAYNILTMKSYEGLLPDDYVAKLTYEQYVANVAVGEALVVQSEAAVATALINLGYCTIISPINGVIGFQNIYQGNLVTASQTTPIVTVNQVSPLYVDFNVPELYFPDIEKYSRLGTLKVIATIPGTTTSYEGKLVFVNNEITTQVGTILLKGEFLNTDEVLWPGQFLDVHLQLHDIPQAILIPSESIKQDTKGPYVFVVDATNTAQKRAVKLGQRLGDMQIITSGVNADEKVVTQGQLAVIPGSKVQIKASP